MGKKASIDELGVTTVLDGRDDGGIGRRSSDTPLLQLLDQAGFGESADRFCKILDGIETIQGQTLSRRDIGQHFVFLLARRRQYTGVTVKLKNSPPRSQFELTAADRDRGTQETRIGHLRGKEIVSNQIVQSFLITFQRQLLAGAICVRWPNGFMSFLSIRFARVNVGRSRQVLITVCLSNKIPCCRYRVRTQMG